MFVRLPEQLFELQLALKYNMSVGPREHPHSTPRVSAQQSRATAQASHRRLDGLKLRLSSRFFWETVSRRVHFYLSRIPRGILRLLDSRVRGQR